METYSKSVSSLQRKLAMHVTSHPVTLRNIELRDFNFEIPLYQREYSWELEQVSDLFADIERASIGNPHFLGSLLLFAKSEQTREIIDGQQRLTTIFLILRSIKNLLSKSDAKSDVRIEKGLRMIDEIIYQRSERVSIADNSNEPRITASKRDKELINSILKGEDMIKKTKKIKSHKLIIDVIRFLEMKIEKINTSYGINGVAPFLDKVMECEYLVMTAEKKQDQFLLFKSLNSKGLELSVADLIKNEVCSNPRWGDKVNEAVDIWDEMREILEKVKADIDSFLFHFINSLKDSSDLSKKIYEIKGGRGSIDYYPPVPEKLFFEVYEHKINEILDTRKFLESLRSASKMYVGIYNPQDDDLYLNGLKTLNISKCYPLLLRGREVLNDRNFEKLCKAVECISFRHSILKEDPKDLEKLYYSLLNKLHSDNDIQKVIHEIRQHSSMKNEDAFKLQFISYAPKSNVSKMMLARIIDITDQERINIKSKDINLEHIMSKTPKKGEFLKLKNRDPETYNSMVNRLGNLTIIKRKLNEEADNDNFPEKKLIYEKSRFKMNKSILEYNKWGFIEIELRQEKLYELAKDIWVL